MSVALDVAGTALQFNATVGATGVTYTGITISGNTLIVGVTFDAGADISPVVVWDSGGSNQSMTQITSLGTATTRAYLFGLVGAASGNKTLKVTWTGTAAGYVNAISWTGADQTGGTTTFNNPQTASAGGVTPVAITTTGTANDASVTVMGADSGVHRTATTGTSWLANSSGPVSNAYGDYKLGVGSISDTIDGAKTAALIGCTIVAAAVAGGFFARPYYDMPAGNRMGG